MTTSINSSNSLTEISSSLLEIGCLLMGAGANTHRIRVTLERIASGLNCETEILITHRTVFLLIKDLKTNEVFNSFKKTPPHGANFTLVSGISKMSWHVIQNNWSLHQIREDINRLKSLNRYPLLTTITFVSFADAGFCRLFGGDYIDMSSAFIATFIAFLVRHYVVQLKFNIYISVVFASFTACFITCIARYFEIGHHPDLAFATAVLFLVPGVPLINSFSDLMDGYVTNGVARGTHALFIAFSIALGMLVNMLIFNL